MKTAILVAYIYNVSGNIVSSASLSSKVIWTNPGIKLSRDNCYKQLGAISFLETYFIKCNINIKCARKNYNKSFIV